jgi:hypothetical protein
MNYIFWEGFKKWGLKSLVIFTILKSHAGPSHQSGRTPSTKTKGGDQGVS